MSIKFQNIHAKTAASRKKDEARLLEEATRALRENDIEIRRSAIEELGLLRSTKSVPVLICGLEDEDSVVRLLCAGALGEIGPAARPAIPTLIARLNDPVWIVRAVSSGAIAEICGPGCDEGEQAGQDPSEPPLGSRTH